MGNKKAAFVTGAARGIGNAIALQLAKDGYNIASMDVIEREKISENIDKIKAVKR